MTEEPRRYVLAVGLDYTAGGVRQPLENAPQEVDLILQTLKGPSFDFSQVSFETLALNALESGDTFLDSLNKWASSPERRSDDHLVVYWTGHGEVRNGELNLLFNKSDPASLYPCLKVDEIIKAAVGEKCILRNILLILDVCYAEQGAFDIASKVDKIYKHRSYDAEPNISVVSVVSSREEAHEMRFAKAFCEALTAAVDSCPPTEAYVSFEKVIGEANVFGTIKIFNVSSPTSATKFFRNCKYIAKTVTPEGRDAFSRIEKGNVSCLVVLSDRERNAEYKLSNCVRTAVELIDSEILGDDVVCIYASEVFQDESCLRTAVKALCRAKVAIVDGTDFEPAVMLLLGIRSVVRSSVTIISVGQNYYIGAKHNIPFAVKNANIVSHSKAQADKGKMEPSELIKNRILDGLRESQSPWYADLEVFDSIRRLHYERRSIVAENEGFMVLCTFDEDYTEKTWKDFVHPALWHRLKLLRKKLPAAHPPSLGVARSFELYSPRIVSQAVYEFIRRAATCIVDWTRWSPNVFFELGVRLAVTSPRHNRTTCILKYGEEKLSDQQHRLVAMFAPIVYRGEGDWKAESHTFDRLFGSPSTNSGLLAENHSFVYKTICENIDVSSQPASVSLDQFLLSDSTLYKFADQRATPVGLYPENLELSKNERAAERERLIAAWAYLLKRHGMDAVIENESLRKSCAKIVDNLFAYHSNDLKQDGKLYDELVAVQERLYESEFE